MIRPLINSSPMLAARLRNHKEHGATMAEYAILVAFIAMIALIGVKLLGPALSNFFTDFAGDL